MLGTIFMLLVVIGTIVYIGKYFYRKAQDGISLLPSGIFMAVMILINLIWGNRIMTAVYKDATSFLNYTTYHPVHGFGELIHGIWSQGIDLGYMAMTALHPLLAAMVILWFAFFLAKQLERVTRRIAGNQNACTIIAAVAGVAGGLLASVGAIAIIGLGLLALGLKIFVDVGSVMNPMCATCQHYQNGRCQLCGEEIYDATHTKCNRHEI